MIRTAAALLVLAALTGPALSAADATPEATNHLSTGHLSTGHLSTGHLSTGHLSKRAARGHAFAEAHCSGCHAITANGVSPNPESPPFEEIANLSGLTRWSLQQFLRDSHNFPAAMNFTVERAQIKDLATYIVTLKRADYHKDI